MTEAEAKVELIRSLYEAWHRGEYGAELFAEDVEWSTPHPGGTVHGRDELLAFLRSYMGAWEEYSQRARGRPRAGRRPAARLPDREGARAQQRRAR